MRCVLIALAASSLASGAACEAKPEGPSTLEQRAEQRAQKASEAATKKAEGKGRADAKADVPITSGTEAPEGAEKVTLALALKDPTIYRVQTFGQVALPMVMGEIMYVREERVALSGCKGDGMERSCTIEHRYTNFEAQGQAGKFIRGDYEKVKEHVTSHEMTASGFRGGTTSVSGGDTTSEIAQGLADVHRFWCMRFPKQPVAVGAKWNDRCTTFVRGKITTREVVWELSELTDDPDGGGKRAQLTYVGEHLESDGTRGTLQGALFFDVALGEPHIMQERIIAAVDAEKGLNTTTTLRYVFAKVLPGNPEKVVQTSGKPFEGKALSSDPLPPPPEAKGKKKRAGKK